MIVDVAKNEKIARRNARIKRAADRGVRQEDIAAQFGVTQPRISQIVTNPHSDFIAVPVQ